MVDGEKSPDNYIISKISIGAIIKNPELLKLVPCHLKNKEMCQNIAKKLPFVIRYVSDWYKTQEMCDQVILENGGTLMFVPYCYKN